MAKSTPLQADERKFESWRKNYDGSWEPRGKLVKGAVEDFFNCKLVVGLDGREVVPTSGSNCEHRRPISVTSSRKENPPTWAVIK